MRALYLSFVALSLILPLLVSAADCPPNYAALDQAENLGRRYADLGDRIHGELTENFYDLQKNSTPEFAAAWNRGHIEGLRALPMKQRNPKKIVGLTDDQIGSLLWRVRNHPLSASNSTLRPIYDCRGVGIGFCFGRAMVAQMEALNMGVAKESVRKIWAVGPMKTSEGEWQHHVATMVRTAKGDWVVLDPLDRRALSISDWLASVERNYPSPNMQLFSSPASRFSPYDARPILPSSARDKFYNNYFQDMLKRSREDARKLVRQKKGVEECATAKSSWWSCFKENIGIYN